MNQPIWWSNLLSLVEQNIMSYFCESCCNLYRQFPFFSAERIFKGKVLLFCIQGFQQLPHVTSKGRAITLQRIPSLWLKGDFANSPTSGQTVAVVAILTILKLLVDLYFSKWELLLLQGWTLCPKAFKQQEGSRRQGCDSKQGGGLCRGDFIPRFRMFCKGKELRLGSSCLCPKCPQMHLFSIISLGLVVWLSCGALG